jgi:Zn-dependent protease with chaperone function
VSFALVGLIVLAAVHFLAASILSAAVAGTLPAVGARLARLHPGPRARWTLALALLPAAGGVVAAVGVALPAWLLCEPRAGAEQPGPVVVALAVAGVALTAGRLGSALLDVWRTSRLVRTLRARGRELAGLGLEATRFPHALPVAALAGILRPRLLLSEPLLGALSPEELVAVVAHERAHQAARENLKRLLLRASPDLLAWLPTGARLRAAFEEAAEAEADRVACVAAPPLVLASALLKVAALAPAGGRLELAAATLHPRGAIAARVRALLARHEEGAIPRRAAPDPGGLPWPLPAAVAVLAVAWACLPAVHRLLESLVQLLS